MDQNPNGNFLSYETVKADIDAMIRSADMCTNLRFQGRKFWNSETNDQEYIDRILRYGPRLESIADHSWHLADAVLIVGPRFNQIDVARSVVLAVLHDKLELWYADNSPLGSPGTGQTTYAFDERLARERHMRELDAARRYLNTLLDATRRYQEPYINELLDDRTASAQFVRAMDKLQVFTVLLRVKKGNMEDTHIVFNVNYSSKFVRRVPFLQPYLDELIDRLMLAVADYRKVDVGGLRSALLVRQGELQFDENQRTEGQTE